MTEFNLKNFDELIKHVQDIKNGLAIEKAKEGKKEKREKTIEYVTLFIAVTSFLLSIYSICDNNKTDERNFKLQRDTHAYNYWLNYLDLAARHPQLANGLKSIDNISVDSLACRDKSHTFYKDTTIRQFVEYAWFVANALGTAEIVSDLTKNDTAWQATIDTIISNHRTYIASTCFVKNHYGEDIQKRIQKFTSK